MTDRDAFIRTIVERPEDDGPRLVYADWLEEQGDCDRAEFIRVQIGLEQYADDHPESAPLRRRADELLKVHRRDWEPTLKSPFFEQERDPVWFRRGFPELHVAATTLLDVGDQLHPTFPVPAVVINALVPLQTRAQVPEAPTLWLPLVETSAFTRVIAIRCALGDLSLRTLAASRNVGALRYLIVEPWGRGVSESAIAALAHSPHLAGLKRLDLDRLAVTDGAAEALAASQELAGLTELDLAGNLVGDRGALALANCELPALEALNLEANRITTRGAQRLADSPRLRKLRYLNLARNPIDRAAERVLRETFGERVVL